MRRSHEALNRGDLDGALADVHPDAEADWSESRSAKGGMIEEVIRGRETLRARIQDAFDHWEISWDQQELLEVSDDQVLSIASVRFRGRDGIELGESRKTAAWRSAKESGSSPRIVHTGLGLTSNGGC